jgi:hypothetical protein
MELALAIGRTTKPGERTLWQVSLLRRSDDGKIEVVQTSTAPRATATGRMLNLMQELQHFLVWGKRKGEK